MIRHLSDIQPVLTSHGVGDKRVLLSSNESQCSITQIAITDIAKGEIAKAHVHPDMQEAFYVLSGELEITLDGEKTICHPDDFVYVDRCTSHELHAVSDVRIMTIGCVIEASRNKYYPMLFKQNCKTLVWGTEDWTISAVPGSESEVENGTWARYKLSELVARHPAEFLGKQVAAKYHDQLPLLAKIIDAKQDLSIQVHPNDEMAQREHGKMGKSEMWYILDAEPGAYLYAGFKEKITPDQFKQLIENSSNKNLSPSGESKGGFCDVLAKHDVHPGDVFYLPAGRVHAICGGIRLVEIQQSSDVTYRIFDYNRPGLDGKPRELHTELAAKAIDYTVYPEYKTDSNSNRVIDEGKGFVDNRLNTPYFSIRVVETSRPFHRNMIKYDSFIIMVNIGSTCKIHVRSTGDEIALEPNASCLIPAVVADYDVIPISSPSKGEDGRLLPKGKIQSSAKVLEAFINNKKNIGSVVSDFFHIH